LARAEGYSALLDYFFDVSVSWISHFEITIKED
jgi:hypothetical protein